MYHKDVKWKGIYCISYYDTIDEMPDKATITFPDGTSKEMTVPEMMNLSNDGWYVIMNSSNYGICDHWTSRPLSEWIRLKFLTCICYKDKNGAILGYNRKAWSTPITRQSDYFKAEVWNA